MERENDRSLQSGWGIPRQFLANTQPAEVDSPKHIGVEMFDAEVTSTGAGKPMSGGGVRTRRAPGFPLVSMVKEGQDDFNDDQDDDDDPQQLGPGGRGLVGH